MVLETKTFEDQETDDHQMIYNYDQNSPTEVVIKPADFTPQSTEVGQYKNNSCTLKPKTEFSFN